MEEKGKKESDPMTAEEISSILDSDLTSQEKSSLLKSALLDVPPLECNTSNSSSGVMLEEKIQLTEAKRKEDDNHLTSDGKSKPNDESLSQPAKAKGTIDPLTGDEISSILSSQLTSQEKSSLLAFNLTEEDNLPSKIKTCVTSSRVETEEEKIKHIETKGKRGPDPLPSDGIPKRSDEPLSLSSPQQQAKVKVGLDVKLTSDEKQSVLACNQNEEKNQHMEKHANEDDKAICGPEKQSPKCTNKGSSFRSRQAALEDCHVLLELQEQEFVITRVKEPQSNIEGEEEERIYKEEAICKYCHQYVFEEEYVLKAKCKCRNLTLIHEECAIEWSKEKGNKCLFCKDEIKNIYVTLSMSRSSSPSHTNKQKIEEPGSSSKGIWCCLCNF